MGPPNNFEEQWAREGQRVRLYIHTQVLYVEDAEELYQETCVSAMKGFAKFRGKSTFLTWCVGIAKKRIANFYRSRSRHRCRTAIFDDEALALLGSAIESFTEDTALEHLNQCLQHLAPDERQLLDWRYREDLTPQEIVAQHERSLTSNTVAKRLSRLRDQLRECITARQQSETGL